MTRDVACDSPSGVEKAVTCDFASSYPGVESASPRPFFAFLKGRASFDSAGWPSWTPMRVTCLFQRGCSANKELAVSFSLALVRLREGLA